MNTSKQDPRTFLRWLAEPETMVALSAVVIALCSLGVSFYQTQLAREHNRKSVEPWLDTVEVYTRDQLFIRVSNKGVGPAYIDSMRIEVEGRSCTISETLECLGVLLGEPLDPA